MKRSLLLIGWLAVTPALTAAGVEFEARLWAPDLAGTARVDDGNGGTLIDLVSDLGFADDEAPEGRLIWRPTKRTSVRLDYASFELGGDARLDRTITFSGSTFRLDALVTSRLDLEFGGLGLAWQLISTRDGRVRLGPLVEARGLRGEAGISTDILGVVPLSAREEFELGFAAAGAVLDIEPTPKLQFSARWTTAVQADQGDLTDVEASLRYFPLDVLALTVGYRRLEIDFADRDERFDLDLDGPFFGGVLRF